MGYIAIATAYEYMTEGYLPEPGKEYGPAGTPDILVDEKSTYIPFIIFTPENIDEYQF
jgi:hypothetical protein